MRFTVWLGVGLLAGNVLWSADGEESVVIASPPPPGQSSSYPGHTIDVSVMTASFVAADRTGRLVRDLRPEELQVFEDGAPVRLLDLTRRTASGEEAKGGSAVAPTRDDGARALEQRVVVYVSAKLGGRSLMKKLCRRVGEEAARLTSLGPVDVVVAAPVPTALTTTEHRPAEVKRALDLAVLKGAGAGEVTSIRKAFARNLERRQDLGASYAVARSRPASVVVQTRIAMSRERAAVRGEIERMAAWLQSQPPMAGGLLVWVTGGFDLNPGEFYLPLVEQVDPLISRTLSSNRDQYSLEHEVRWLVEVAVSLGWTVLPVTAVQRDFLFGMDVSGLDMSGQAAVKGSIRLASQGTDFTQVNPTRPLRIVAEATGGTVASVSNQLSAAIDRVEAAYRIEYQVDRPLDGRLHQIEIRCLRPGIRIWCGRQVASGTSRGLAAGRALCLLAGGEDRGGLDLSATVNNIARAGKGQKIGDLGLTADLGTLRSLLRPLALGKIRVTVVVEIQDGSPFVNHQEIDIDWDRMEDVWRFSAGLKWPKRATRVAVVVEELVSSTWGATTLELS